MSGQSQGVALSMAISSTSGIISHSMVAPLERIKLLLQTQNEIVKTGRLLEPYKGIANCIARTYRNEGILSFWRGNVAGCLGGFSSKMLNFTLKEKIRSVIKSNPQDSQALNFTKNILSGSGAGFLSFGLVYSLDYTRQRLATDVKSTSSAKRQFSGLVDVYRKTMASDGIVGLHRGMVVSCVGIVVYRGLYFGLYDSMRPIVLGSNPPGSSANLLSAFVLGYAVTLSAGLMSYPLDTIRRRMMMRSCEAIKYKGAVDCLVQIVRNDGVRALWKGAAINVFTGAAGAVMLVMFDMVKSRPARQQ